MKHDNVYFLQLSRIIFNDDNYKSLSTHARWLYVVLNELEHRFTGENTDFFYRTNRDLATDAQMSESTLKRAKKELEDTDLIETWQSHFVSDKGTKKEKLSAMHFTCYRIRK
ncbi:MAG: replication initiator protein A [Oscillospiraceae bacterium]|nr:replication initiator protein A [Oscillospiraceae bacterium]